jgi:hypothetical protein
MRSYAQFGGNQTIGQVAVEKSAGIALGTGTLIEGLPAATRSLMNNPGGVFIPTPSINTGSN